MSRVGPLGDAPPGESDPANASWVAEAPGPRRRTLADDVANTIVFSLSAAARNYTGAGFDLNSRFHM